MVVLKTLLTESLQPGNGFKLLLQQVLNIAVNNLFQLAAIHVRLGKAPPDGSQVGTKDKTWYHVEYVRMGAVTNTPVYRLTPVTAYTGG